MLNFVQTKSNDFVYTVKYRINTSCLPIRTYEKHQQTHLSHLVYHLTDSLLRLINECRRRRISLYVGGDESVERRRGHCIHNRLFPAYRESGQSDDRHRAAVRHLVATLQSDLQLLRMIAATPYGLP